MISTLLPPRLLEHTRFVIGRSERLIVARTWDDLRCKLEVCPVSVALIDPWVAGSRNTHELERTHERFPAIPIVAYFELTPKVVGAVAHLSLVGINQFIIRSYDDSPTKMMSALNKARSSRLTDHFLATLEPHLRVLPSTLRDTVEKMFRDPHRYFHARDLASCAEVSLSCLYRSFNSAGFAAPKNMVIAAKLLRAFGHLSNPGQSVQGAALKLGFGHPRTLVTLANKVLRVSASRMRSDLKEEAMFDRLLNWVTSSSSVIAGDKDAASL